MSGGQWDYRHRYVAEELWNTGMGFIEEVIEQVKQDFAATHPEHRRITADEIAAILDGAAYLELVKPQIEALRAQLTALMGYESKVYKVIEALDYLYSGDSNYDSCAEEIREVLESQR